jgi:hypothetical protein
MLRQPDESSTRNDELELIRRACVDLGADLEMAELVLASHAHDRTLLDVMLANGDSLRDHVQCKLAVWEGIFNDSLYYVDKYVVIFRNIADVYASDLKEFACYSQFARHNGK